MKRFSGFLAAACAAWLSADAQEAVVTASNTAAVAVVTNVPQTGTNQAPPAAEAGLPPAAEWTGFVRVLRGDAGDVRAVRLVVGDKLMAVELNDKGRELGNTPKTRQVAVRGALDMRDGRAWLIVTDFRDATDSLPPPPPAATNAPAPAASTNEPAATNAPAAAPAP